MSKLSLINHLLTKGKTHSWDELAKIHSLNTAEIARHAWRQYQDQSNNSQTKTPTAQPNQVPVRIPESDIEQANYIVELEDKIIELVEKMKSLPKNGTGGFNVGHNPLDYSLELQKEMFLSEMRNNSIRRRTQRNRNESIERKCLMELSIFDLHIGKLAWDKETGEDYDIEIAIERYQNSIEELLSRVNPNVIDRFLLPIGNDMINVDGKTNTTTAGTPQSCDSRFGKMFRAAKDLIINSVDRLTEIAPVDVVVVPGNHDELTMFTLGEVLDAWFYNHQDVKIYNEPKLRKYYQFGQNMIVFTHGDKEKHQDLGLIAATEEPQMWANTKFREVHMGHLHKSKSMSYMTIDEFQGFKVRILPSLSGTDAWHAGKGYMSQKSAEAYLWHKDKGLISTHFYNL